MISQLALHPLVSLLHAPKPDTHAAALDALSVLAELPQARVARCARVMLQREAAAVWPRVWPTRTRSLRRSPAPCGPLCGTPERACGAASPKVSHKGRIVPCCCPHTPRPPKTIALCGGVRPVRALNSARNVPRLSRPRGDAPFLRTNAAHRATHARPPYHHHLAAPPHRCKWTWCGWAPCVRCWSSLRPRAPPTPTSGLSRSRRFCTSQAMAPI
eukprot:3678839-Prymnesium_polylepis.1